MTTKITSKNDSSAHIDKTGLSDVVIGVLAGIDQAGVPLVVFPESQSPIGLPARATVILNNDDIGREVALLFEGGDASRPLVIGRIQPRQPAVKQEPESDPLNVQMDGDSITLSAAKEVVLKCGKASITLTRAGKILIRGTYLLSRSSGANRIKGGSIQLN
ncbi:DUF6484 domain-containing protein [Neptunomonas sp.]|uniref:DUF6484 domain-containing protein n=1 Tax=Neptunomonas sp. TaxID=1971898 RepID=UPI0025F623AE|nr:DUF6484 domain-containing protein [Neptunomonas sp.]